MSGFAAVRKPPGGRRARQGIKRLTDRGAQKPFQVNTPLAFSGMHLV
jgi:hypothetical protein